MDFGFFGVIDVIIVLMVIIFLSVGWRKGFLLKVVEMASGIFGLIGSILLARPFSKVLDKWMGDDVSDRITTYLEENTDGLFSQTLNETNVREGFSEMNLPNFMVDWIVRSIDFDAAHANLIEAVEPYLTSLTLLLIAFVTLFFGSMIIFFILKLLAEAITSVPFIEQVDKVLGVLFGFVKVAALIYILLFLLGLIITIPGINNLIGDFIETDMKLSSNEFRLSKHLYDNNILRLLLEVFL